MACFRRGSTGDVDHVGVARAGRPRHVVRARASRSHRRRDVRRRGEDVAGRSDSCSCAGVGGYIPKCGQTHT